MKPNKENIIIDILAELEKGISYKTCLSLNDVLWQVSERTFCRYWKIASDKYREQQAATEIELSSIRIEAKKERLKKAILTKDERMEILTKMAKGKLIYYQMINTKAGSYNMPIIPTMADRKNAIAELNKMDGSYTPIQTDIMSGGERLNAPIFNIILDNDEDEIV